MKINTLITEFVSDFIEMVTDDSFTCYEKAVFLIFFSFLACVLVIAAWNGILIKLDMVQGGGPIGMMVRLLNIHQLFVFPS